MTALDPRIAKAAYEAMMREELGTAIRSNPELLRYVNRMYQREVYYRIFVDIVVLAFLIAILILYIAPIVQSSMGVAL